MSTRDPEHHVARLPSSQAQDARTGRLGQDWKSIQARIDAGRTTLGAVFAGGDDSSEARRLRELSRQSISQLEFDPPASVRSDLALAEEEWARLAGTGSRDGER